MATGRRRGHLRAPQTGGIPLHRETQRIPAVEVAGDGHGAGRVVVKREYDTPALQPRGPGAGAPILPVRLPERCNDGRGRIHDAVALPNRRDPGDGLAVWRRIRRTSAGSRSGLASSIWATTDATMGAAKEVPSTCW